MYAIALILGGLVIAGFIVYGISSFVSDHSELKSDAQKWRDLQNEKENN